MTSRERVHAVIRHQKPDRIPVYGWVAANLGPQITEAFGSIAAFEDKYEFDYAHLFGGPPTYTPAGVEAAAKAFPGGFEPEAAIDLPLTDPCDTTAYADLVAQVKHHKEERDRWVYVQTPGIFEATNGLFGIQNHLMYLALYPEELLRVYERQANWNKEFAMCCLDIGVDQIHVSDDWGAQNGLMFSTEQWWDLIYPAHKITTDAVKKRGAILSLHSDGNVNSIVDGIIALGYDVVHPWQESAGMSLDKFKSDYLGKFVVMGGLDVQDSIGFGQFEKLEHDIRRVLGMFRDGGLLYCTTHFIQDHCTMEELVFAYDLIYKLVRQ